LGGTFGWRATWWFLAGVTFIVALLFGVLFRFRLGLSSDEDETSVPVEVSLAKGVSVYKNGMVWVLITANFLINFSSMALMQFVPVAMGDQFNASVQTIGNTMALGGMIAIGMAIVPAVLADRLGTRKWVILAFVLPVVPLSLLLNTNDLDTYRVVVVVFRALIGSTAAVLYALPRQLLPPKDVPLAMGLYSLSGGAVAYAAPQLLGVLRDVSGGFSLGWYITAGVTLAACVLVLRLRIK
jgi:NNP family nitrate/nitrite transporter-like MFS transporter